MGVKYVKDFSFDSGFGFSGSTGKTPVRAHMRKAAGGEVRNPINKFPKLSKAMVGKPAAKAGGKTPDKKFSGQKVAKYAKGGHVKKYADGGDVAPTKMLPPPPGKGSGPEPQQTFVMPGPGKGPAQGGDPQMPPEVVGPGPVERIPEEYPQERFYLPPLEQANFPIERPQFNIESQEQTNARLAAERDARRQNRMDIMGGRGEPGGRHMPMGALNRMASAPAPAPAPAPRAPAPAPRPAMSNEQKARQIMDRYIAGPRSRRSVPVAPQDAMIAPPSPAMYARGGKVSKGQAKVGRVMGEFKRGELHSGSKKGPVVTNPKQAKAIALSEARSAGAKIPVKKSMGGKACG